MKNNLWNKIFRKKKLQEFLEKCEEARQIVGFHAELEQKVRNAQTLGDLLAIHKKAWELGFKNVNLGPCKWGMFRTENIPTMTPDEVYIGGIYGLITQNIPFWERHKDEDMSCNGFGIDEDIKIYDLLMDRYKGVLSSNFRAIERKAMEFLVENNQPFGPNDTYTF